VPDRRTILLALLRDGGWRKLPAAFYCDSLAPALSALEEQKGLQATGVGILSLG
jgi:hypothetical protein